MAGVKKVLAPRSDVSTLDIVETAWNSFEEYFALNASVERVFRDYCGRFKRGPARIITAELVAGLYSPELKTKVATTFNIKSRWKEHLDLVYSVSQKAAEAWATVEQTDKLRRV